MMSKQKTKEIITNIRAHKSNINRKDRMEYFGWMNDFKIKFQGNDRLGMMIQIIKQIKIAKQKLNQTIEYQQKKLVFLFAEEKKIDCFKNFVAP